MSYAHFDNDEEGIQASHRALEDVRALIRRRAGTSSKARTTQENGLDAALQIQLENLEDMLREITDARFARSLAGEGDGDQMSGDENVDLLVFIVTTAREVVDSNGLSALASLGPAWSPPPAIEPVQVFRCVESPSLSAHVQAASLVSAPYATRSDGPKIVKLDGNGSSRVDIPKPKGKQRQLSSPGSPSPEPSPSYAPSEVSELDYADREVGDWSSETVDWDLPSPPPPPPPPPPPTSSSANDPSTGKGKQRASPEDRISPSIRIPISRSFGSSSKGRREDTDNRVKRNLRSDATPSDDDEVVFFQADRVPGDHSSLDDPNIQSTLIKFFLSRLADSEDSDLPDDLLRQLPHLNSSTSGDSNLKPGQACAQRLSELLNGSRNRHVWNDEFYQSSSSQSPTDSVIEGLKDDFEGSLPASPARSEPVTLECCIACGDFVESSDDSVLMSPCGHPYCETCLLNLVSAYCKDESLHPIRCCKMDVPMGDIESILCNTEELARFQEKYEEYSTPFDKRTYCPQRNCSQFIRPRKATPGVVFSRSWSETAPCPSCSTLVCILCKELAHPGDKCDVKKNTARLHELAKEKEWQTCSNCKSIVERIDGCLHMVCRCGFEFCYRCGAKYTGPGMCGH